MSRWSGRSERRAGDRNGCRRQPQPDLRSRTPMSHTSRHTTRRASTRYEREFDTMSNTINTNGRPIRKSLASQLDRLDGIIDTLGDGLNEAVADVVRHA